MEQHSKSCSLAQHVAHHAVKLKSLTHTTLINLGEYKVHRLQRHFLLRFAHSCQADNSDDVRMCVSVHAI